MFSKLALRHDTKKSDQTIHVLVEQTKIDAGGKPSTLFPPGGHVELILQN